jgi:hypothetical protein
LTDNSANDRIHIVPILEVEDYMDAVFFLFMRQK